MIYDFGKGITADFILEKLKSQLAKESDFQFERFDAIPHEKITFKGGSFIYRNSEHEYYMFAYKKRFSTITFDAFPKYHITNCKTRESYSGFWFANRMPVKVYCIDQRMDLGEHDLELCQNCQRDLNFFSYGDENTDWYDVILKKAASRDYTENDLRFDGYTRDWNQVSKAYRFKKGFVCESCNIDLSERRAEWFCEVHHKDYDKTNNSLENLSCLCVRCHASVNERHRQNYADGKNRTKLNQFNIHFPGSNVKKTHTDRIDDLPF